MNLPTIMPIQGVLNGYLKKNEIHEDKMGRQNTLTYVLFVGLKTWEEPTIKNWSSEERIYKYSKKNKNRPGVVKKSLFGNLDSKKNVRKMKNMKKKSINNPNRKLNIKEGKYATSEDEDASLLYFAYFYS